MCGGSNVANANWMPPVDTISEMDKVDISYKAPVVDHVETPIKYHD